MTGTPSGSLTGIGGKAEISEKNGFFNRPEQESPVQSAAARRDPMFYLTMPGLSGIIKW